MNAFLGLPIWTLHLLPDVGYSESLTQLLTHIKGTLVRDDQETELLKTDHG